MKTIEVTDELYTKLIDLAKEMTTQNMRSTRMPHMFQIQEQREVAAYDGCGESIWINSESDTLRRDEIKSFIIEDLKNNHYDFCIMDYESKEELDKAIEEYLEELDFGYYLEEHRDNWRQIQVTTEPTYKNAFLTAKACQEHIESNHYHYNEPKVYLNSAWRNPEMELVSEFLCGLVGKKMHT